jgi:hypothetical protein
MSRRGWALFAVMGVLWGVPYLMIKVAVAEASPPCWSSRGPGSAPSSCCRWLCAAARRGASAGLLAARDLGQSACQILGDEPILHAYRDSYRRRQRPTITNP